MEFQLIRYPYHIRILKFVEGTSRQILTHHSLKFDILSKMIKPSFYSLILESLELLPHIGTKHLNGSVANDDNTMYNNLQIKIFLILCLII